MAIGHADVLQLPAGLVLRCWVTGKPRPKGSLDLGARGKAKENNQHGVRWREHVAAVCRSQYAGRPPVGVPVAVNLSFMFERPANPLFPVPATVDTGDRDKLIRNVLDALSFCGTRCARRCRKHAGVYVDDALAIDGKETKRYAPEGGAPGVLIEVVRLDLEGL